MVRADFHLHTTVSPDAQDDILAMCKHAQTLGFTTLCFTEHDDAYSKKFGLDVPAHMASIALAKETFPSLAIRTGIEVGYAIDSMPLSLAHIAELSPDYILLSVHAVDGIDPYFGEQYYKGRSREQGIDVYLAAVQEAITTFKDFDTLAHIGYVGRYAPVGVVPKALCYADAPDTIDSILKKLIQDGRSLEINTSEIKKGGDMIPSRDILARYFVLGGRIVTLGSDSHRASTIGDGFAIVAETLLSLGFTHHAVFEQRKMTTLPL